MPYLIDYLSLKLLKTTDTDEKAIAAPAIIGFSKKPVNGNNIPAAKGMAMTL
jgi:hypothetical protein